MFSIIPMESSIKLFGLTHLSVLLIGLLLAFVVVKYNKESKLFERLSTSIMVCAFTCLYIWYYFSPESFIMKGLPLYTCRIAVYMLVAGVFFNKELWLKLGVYWGLFGGFFGLVFPTIFDYPFPHILQLATFYLHVYLFVISTYYLFVKKLRMNKDDLKMCCKATIIFLTIAHVTNIVLDTNYAATFKMPGVLLKLGFSLPSSICFVAVVVGYLAAIIVQHLIVNHYNKKLAHNEND